MACEHTVTCERCGQTVRVGADPVPRLNMREAAEQIRRVLEDGVAQGVRIHRLAPGAPVTR